MRSSNLRDEAMFRMGASALGMFAGSIISLLVFVPLMAVGWAATPLPRLLLAGAVSGAVCGVVVPGVALRAFEGLVHFFAGMFTALAGGDDPSFQDTPRWLFAAFWIGVLYFGGIWLWLQIMAFAK